MDTVSYCELSAKKEGSDWSTFGTLMVMSADDSPHYGANVKLDGPGEYRASFRFQPPPYNAYFRHTDKETGVPGWWNPFKDS